MKGIPGRVVTGRTAENDELYNSYSNYVDAINGYDLTLTIDSTIQSYAEQILEKGIAAYDVQDGGVCIVADPNTMEILAMASSPEFDPNNYSAIMDSLLQGEASSNVQGIYEQLKAENDPKSPPRSSSPTQSCSSRPRPRPTPPSGRPSGGTRG